MLYDGENVVQSHVADLKTRIESITGLLNKSVYAYTQEEFLNRAKVIQYPAVGIFYTGLQRVGDRRSEDAVLQFDLILADDTAHSCGTEPADTDPVTLLLSLIRQKLHVNTLGTEKSWVLISEAAFDLGDNKKVGYVQRWTAIVSNI